MATSKMTAVALACVLAGMETSIAQADGPPRQRERPALEWTACPHDKGPGDQQCAELQVPLDHADPDGPKITVGVSRLRSERPAERRGALLVLAGGPGGSGVQRLAQKGAALRKETRGLYDLVTLDPRGVGRSTRADCGLDAADRTLIKLRAWPGPGGELDEVVAHGRRTAKACQRNGGATLRSFTTANQVRDIERLRRALGVEKLSAWGNSYGAYVGAVYAQKYPHRTDRWVLDSGQDPDPAKVSRNWVANTSRAVDLRFPDFAGWAADPARETEGLRLAERPGDVRTLFLELAARLDGEPRDTATPGVQLTGNALRQAMHGALYDDAHFAGLARLIQDAADPEATPVLPPDLAHAAPDRDVAVMMGVICNDVRWPGRIDAYERAVAADKARYPLTAGMPGSLLPCAFWKDAPVERPTRITDEGPSNILMVQSLRDPTAPHFSGVRLREALGSRARLVSVDRGGHGVYLGVGGACSTELVTRFLTTGQRPAADVHCAD
ncbi:alpha/beta hydrolase [Streptomyces yaizuensis]|uniref:Alpha/beta hydrolase n=1 Tax=Streptomyces yaizuensis TaxID=2989713 RepID=A0ABQ5NZQ3_9ACTN|nr:alpha/beta hydrolase [Streptomyces sp. YSPA8]GLF95833.1 alpha/beta hydrolase [Streptomyces sp. YSPA8]